MPRGQLKIETAPDVDCSAVLASLNDARKRLQLGGRIRQLPPDFNDRVQATTQDWLDAINGQAENLSNEMKAGRVTKTQAQSWLSFQTLARPANFDRALLHTPEPADEVEEHGIRYRVNSDGSKQIIGPV